MISNPLELTKLLSKGTKKKVEDARDICMMPKEKEKTTPKKVERGT